MIRSPILPSCLDLRPGITFPPICTHAVVPPSLTMSSTLILVRVSRPTTSAHPCHLTSSLLPCLLAFKNRRSSETIMRIVVPRVANVGPDDSLIFHFHGLLQMQSFPGGIRISIAYGSWPIADAIFFRGGSRISIGRMADSILLWGKQRKRVWIWRIAKLFPPHHERENVWNAPA